MLVVARESAVAYLQVRFHENEDASIETCNVSKPSKNCERPLSALQKCIQFCLKPVPNLASRDLVCTIANGRNIVFHPLLAKYVVNSPRYEDPLGLK